jgi:cell division protease FtsH
MNRRVRTLMFWFLIVVSGVLFWQVVRSNPADRQSGAEIDYSTFISQAQAGQIASVRITGARIDGVYREERGKFWLIGPSNSAVFLGVLQDKGVEIRFRDVQTENLPLQLLGTWAPLILLGALWFFMIRVWRARIPPGARGSNLDPSDRQPLTPQ